MPELPDIEVFTKNLDSLLRLKKVAAVKIVNGKKLSGSSAAWNRALKGRTLKKVFRSGKEMRFEFTGNIIVGLHLMLTGDVFIFEKKNTHHSTIAEIKFSDGTGLALTDRMRNANIKLNPVDKTSPDALSPALNFKYLKAQLQRKTAIKKLLINQDIIRGIGNSYSDEILWQARISPYAVSNAIPDKKIRELVSIIKKLLRKEIKQIGKNYPGKINGEVKDFLQIHTKNRLTSPTGKPIIIDKNGMMKTYYTSEQVLYK